MSLATSSPTVRAGRVSALGLNTRVLEAGPADATEAVLFLHGGPGSAEDWHDLMLRVGGFTRAIAFDLPARRPSDGAERRLGGEDDRFLPVVQAGRQRESFPAGEVVVLEGCGHYPAPE
jgi:pimeloyl-ACP methyl ester carboxylesterase